MSFSKSKRAELEKARLRLRRMLVNYYRGDAPDYDEEEYAELTGRVRALEAEAPELRDWDSPTTRVLPPLLDPFPSRAHASLRGRAASLAVEPADLGGVGRTERRQRLFDRIAWAAEYRKPRRRDGGGHGERVRLRGGQPAHGLWCQLHWIRHDDHGGGPRARLHCPGTGRLCRSCQEFGPSMSDTGHDRGHPHLRPAGSLASAPACARDRFLRRLAAPPSVKQWSLTTLRDKPIKIGA